LRAVLTPDVITAIRGAHREPQAMDLPPAGLMDEAARYARPVEALHPDGLARPRCGGDHFGIHRRHRDPVIDYRCRDCRRAFDAFTGTAPQKTGRPPSAPVLILRG
jgi:hypothetical protein